MRGAMWRTPPRTGVRAPTRGGGWVSSVRQGPGACGRWGHDRRRLLGGALSVRGWLVVGAGVWCGARSVSSQWAGGCCWNPDWSQKIVAAAEPRPHCVVRGAASALFAAAVTQVVQCPARRPEPQSAPTVLRGQRFARLRGCARAPLTGRVLGARLNRVVGGIRPERPRQQQG